MKEFSACAKEKMIVAVIKSAVRRVIKKGYLIFLLFPSWLHAEDTLVTDPASSIGRVIFVLAGMIALIFFLAYWAKRLQGMNRSRFPASANTTQAIKTLATVSLGLKEKISLIQVGEQQILIGITAQSIQTLLVLDEPIPQADVDQQTPIFQALLKKALTKA